MCLLSPVTYHASSGAAGVASYETFALLESGLSGGTDGDVAELRTADGLVGIWQVWSSALYAISRVDLTAASSGTFRAGTDYVLHGSLGATWQTPGASGGLRLDTDGLITWPCLGQRNGYPPKSAQVYGLFTGGTATNNQRVGVGWASALGDYYLGSAAIYGSGTTTWRNGSVYGAIATLAQNFVSPASTSYIVATAAAPIPAAFWLTSQTNGHDGADTNGSLVGGLTRDDASNPGSAQLYYLNTTPTTPNQDDHEVCVALNDSGSGDTYFTIQTIRAQGVLP